MGRHQEGHMRRQHLTVATTFGVLLLSTMFLVEDVNAQRASITHTIFMTAVEFKGATTVDKLAPPATNPAGLSKGYGYKAPGEAEKIAPTKWEVASYAFTPGFVTVHQGDTVTIIVFVVNGDKHEVAVLAPDGQVVVPTATWHRGQEHRRSFVAEKVGTYRLSCSIHAPTMTATILVLPR